jgi:dipeptidyl-peptidase-4
MTLHALFRAPEYFKVGVASSPGADWKHYDTIYTERYMGTPQGNPEGYKSASPVTYAGKLQGALYIQHGLMDNNVHVQQVVEVMDALIKAGKDFKLMLYPEERHGTSNPARAMFSYNTMIAFFNDHLHPEQ